MNNKTTVRLLKRIGACEDAVNWAIQHGGSSAELWQECERGDWMGWYLGKSPEYNQSKDFYLALAELIEKQAVPIYAKYNPKERALKHVVNTLRDYANGKATREDLKSAADAADAAYAAAFAAHAALAALAAASAAADAASSAYAYAAAHAVAYAAAFAAKTKSLRQSADIFRKYFPEM